MDPSSLTPAWSPEDQCLATSSQIITKPLNTPPHPLLDKWLLGALLKVVVNDGDKYKDREVVASIVKDESIWQVYNTLKGLAPAWVLTKSPNPTRNNGLLMVVKGEHCSKYVRQIHHQYHEDNSNKQVLVILAVVKKIDGAADTLTGEQLKLSPDSLCLAFKTSKDKKLNVNLMNSLRENACKRR